MEALMEFYNDTKYKNLFRYFAEVAAVPRVSGNTAPIAEYLVRFAEEHGLYAERDGADNVIIKKPASAGYEEHEPIILQGHTDMVADGDEAAIERLSSEGVELRLDGEFIRAAGTTLGADNGVAMAYMLTLLDDASLAHPAIEAVFTSNEEIGLLGAKALDTSGLAGRRMINLDSDAEGEFTVGCAGGLRMDIRLPVLRDYADGFSYRLIISGLRGGHSGTEINAGRVNAIKLCGEIMSKVGGVISSIDGGNADNAIASNCECLFTSELKYVEINDVLTEYKTKYESETGLKLILTEGDYSLPLTAEATNKVLLLIETVPSGVVKMSEEVAGAVRTSANQGIAKMYDEEFALTLSLRSSSDEEKAELRDAVTMFCSGIGAECTEHGDYPGWEYTGSSSLTERMSEMYRGMYGAEPRILEIHAGLECGIFARAIPSLDCVSIGADVFDIHTRDERLSIESFVRVWEYLCEVIRSL